MDYHTSTFNQAFALALLGCIIATAVVSIGGYLRRPHDLSTVGGSTVLRPGIRGWYFETLQPFVDLCVRWGVRPAYLSCAQLVGSVLVAACYGAGLLFTAGWLLLCTGTFDIIDGRVARRTNSGSRRGAFLDSVVDRFADSIAYLGLVIFFRDSWVVWAVLFALLGSLMVSYVRARAEGLGAQCTVGLLQRAGALRHSRVRHHFRLTGRTYQRVVAAGAALLADHCDHCGFGRAQQFDRATKGAPRLASARRIVPCLRARKVLSLPARPSASWASSS